MSLVLARDTGPACSILSAVVKRNWAIAPVMPHAISSPISLSVSGTLSLSVKYIMASPRTSVVIECQKMTTEDGVFFSLLMQTMVDAWQTHDMNARIVPLVRVSAYCSAS